MAASIFLQGRLGANIHIAVSPIPPLPRKRERARGEGACNPPSTIHPRWNTLRYSAPDGLWSYLPPSRAVAWRPPVLRGIRAFLNSTAP